MSNEQKLKEVFHLMEKKIEDLKVVSLATADGFNIHTHFCRDQDFEDDKLAAVTSSLLALSNAASKQLIGSSLVSSTVETKDGDMLLVNTKYEGKDCVICFITGNKQNKGHTRYFGLKLAQLVSERFLNH